MLFELLKDVVKLILLLMSIDLPIRACVRVKGPAWGRSLQMRRVQILSTLISAAAAIKVTEDVLGQDSGPIDEAILWNIHHWVSPRLKVAFEVITVTGPFATLFQLWA
ncbi:MAG: hypothetical protein C0487_06500 [Leptothrix sp. (in: Bacteria)]|nr:hypothetical protein [Leptothrix sp. (in: b-proteobacteria)]